MMPFDLPYLSELTPNVIATLIGASVTLLAALINLRIAWRREVLARLQNARGSKPRRGLLFAITFMVFAGVVGGYALALYLMQQTDSESALLRAELRTRVAQIQNSAERLESARTQERQLAMAELRQQEDRRRGAEGVTAAARIAPCRARSGATCSVDEAVYVAVCAALPARAVAVELVPQARFDGDVATTPAPTVLGADLGTARLAAQASERVEPNGKLLCLDAWSWDSERALDVRIVVKFLVGESNPPAPARPLAETVSPAPAI